SVSVSCVPASGSTFNKGPTTVTCQATDSSNNTGSCTFIVTVTDTEKPTISCPANIVVSTAAGRCSSNVTYAVTASDNCGAATVTCSPASGSAFNQGTTPVNCTANDGNGNSATCSFSVTVNDTEKPTI